MAWTDAEIAGSLRTTIGTGAYGRIDGFPHHVLRQRDRRETFGSVAQCDDRRCHAPPCQPASESGAAPTRGGS